MAKFEGAKLKTVSGIRGQVKKALRDGQPGNFRASFEDKILMSDIVVCRLWVPVEIKKFYNPVLSLLGSSTPAAIASAVTGGGGSAAQSAVAKKNVRESGGEDKGKGKGEVEWQGMRSQAQIRREEQIPITYNKDSTYKPVERQVRQFNKVNVSKKLESALPFASKSKLEKKKNPESYLARRAVVLDSTDRQRRGLVSMVSAIAKDKTDKRKEAKAKSLAVKVKKQAKITEKFADVHKEERKRKYRDQGKETLRNEKKARKGHD